MKIGILLYPVSESPCDKAEVPVSFYIAKLSLAHVNMSYLVVVETECIFIIP
jgi:hypothetical protein